MELKLPWKLISLANRAICYIEGSPNCRGYKMLLAIDVGNTNIMIGVFDNQKVKVCWRLATDWNSTEDELGIIIKNLLHHSSLSPEEITGVAVSSVVPPLMYSLERMADKYFSVKPLVVRPDLQTGLKILLDNPREIGADRVVNALAGYTLYGGPLIIVDFGTATTFCAISGGPIWVVQLPQDRHLCRGAI